MSIVRLYMRVRCGVLGHNFTDSGHSPILKRSYRCCRWCADMHPDDEQAVNAVFAADERRWVLEEQQ